QKRSFVNKFTEIFRAIQLELQYSKSEILELYLNHLPYGGNIEGAGTASLFYFGKAPMALSLSESVILSVIPNRPGSLNIQTRLAAIEQSRNYWLHYFNDDGTFNRNLIAEALKEPVAIQKHELLKIAPHLSLQLKNTYKDSARITCTIAYYRQVQVENILKRYVEKTTTRNIKNGSAIVIDNVTGNVLVYCGSNNFNDRLNAGQVDGAKGLRSPGSALKPFLYAKGFDLGLYTPGTVVYDVPITINGYSPKNYDETFSGPVTVNDALARSLNIPAVNTLNEIGTPVFVKELQQLGFQSVENKNTGLSLALGGCGVTLFELTNAYAALANKGMYRPCQLLQYRKPNTSIPVISEAAAFLTTQILQTLNRPDLPAAYFNQTFKMPKVAWKTGTSFGRKDAWAIGYNKRYTIGVWLGNFDGEGVPSLNGAEIATPLLFEIFNTMDYASDKQWFASPKTIDYHYVCSKSGHLPSAFCSQPIMDAFIPDKTIQQFCTHMKEVMVNADSSMSYCNSCIGLSPYTVKLYPNYPANLLNYYIQEKIAYKVVPAHNPACQRVEHSTGPKIISPTHEAEYLIETSSHVQLMLNAEADNRTGKILWYINDKLVATSVPNQPVFVHPPIGRLKITCSDESGRKSTVRVVTKAF
ncbi:MAG: penicillin-binding protein 1C, partial [Bacteroidota bacterium]